MISRFLLIIILLLSVAVYAQDDLKVISSNRQSILLEYTPSFSDTSTIQINNSNYYKVALPLGYVANPMKWGNPAIPYRNLNLGVPNETGNTIEIVSSSFVSVSGQIAPIPTPVKEDNVVVSKYEIGDGYYNYKPEPDLVSFGTYGLMRSIPTQVIVISPVKFNPNQNEIKFYTKIIFRITYSSNQKIAAKPASDFLSGALLNFDVAKYWTEDNGAGRLNKISEVKSSVLASGTWGRFEAPYEGIYKITRDMLPSLGINPDSVDPSTIKIYNSGGKILPEDVNASRPEDLVENAILFVGSDPKHFGSGDYILLYGRGTDFWGYDSASGLVKRFHNPYSNHNYYWITSGGTAGKRMSPQPSLNVTNPYIQTTSNGYADWDEDKINIGKSGREYLGDAFNQNSTTMTYTEQLAGRIDGSPINYYIRFVNASSDPLGISVAENSNPIYNGTFYGFGTSLYTFGVAKYLTLTYSGSLGANNRSQLKFNVTPSSDAARGYLDYFEIRYQKNLSAVSNNLMFYSKDTSSVIQYNLSGFSSSAIKVFNISNYSDVKLITDYVMLSGGECRFQTSETRGHVSKYYAVSDSFFTPTDLSKISNHVSQDVRAIQPGAKFIIITSSQFDDAAEKLKAYRENTAKYKLSTDVVNVQDIYNEFSCGSVDPTAVRDFIKYAYDNWQIKPEYVLLFGKGTYDAKNVEGNNNDFVPTYQTEESLDELSSYPTDDYFVRVNGNDAIIDLAYGRIQASTDEEANNIVKKIIYYETQSDEGAWRNQISLVADDGWHGSTYEGTDHTAASEVLADNYIPSSFNLNKIYLAAYPVVITSVGRRMPDVNKAIISAINNGTLILNFIGHGAPDVWADERVFVQSTTVPQLHNSRYFFLTAATCDFARFDDPNLQSATGQMLLMQDAGCISAFSSTRPVYSSYNHDLLNKFYSSMFFPSKDSNGVPLTLGQIAFITKQTYFQENDKKYEIFGDPTLRILIPQYNAAVDSVNNLPTTSNVQIKALSNVNVKGEIEKSDGSLWSDYNGTGILTVFDSQREVALPALNNYNMTVQGGVIFRGGVSVINGRFDANFVVPKDISYENKAGKIVFYFYNNNGDGVGSTTNIIVGGTDSSVVDNKIGPDINVFFDDTTYTNASLINPNSVLYVKLYDSNGLNTTGTGVGHKLEGVLNDDINNPIDFTNYFTGDLNAGGKSGLVKYGFTNLDPGDYKLKVTAWDVFNNYSSKTVYFTVVNNEGLTIKNVYNYPDPFQYNTTFTFQQNLSKPINVKVRVYTVAGRLVREIEKPAINEKFVKINWDGRDQDGDLLANGTYLYKIIVQTTDGAYSKSVLGKLAIIR